MSILAVVKSMIQSNRNLNRVVMPAYMASIHPIAVRRRAAQLKLAVRYFDLHIEILSKNRVIRISKKHAIYINDVIENFDFYFQAVCYVRIGSEMIVDYSTPRYHDVNGYDRHPIFFASFAEPVVTAEQYVEFARLENGAVALDLGAYSGLTSIIMRDLVGESGRVVAVDADQTNLSAIHKNFSIYERLTGRKIELLEGAVWTHNDGITFSSEGNMGSSATAFVGDRLDVARPVASYKLSTIAERLALPKVDFIKCDIEGAEAVIFDDQRFFERYRPRIIAEVHRVKGEMTSGALARTLLRYDYHCAEAQQTGSHLPLLECVPNL